MLFLFCSARMIFFFGGGEGGGIRKTRERYNKSPEK